MPDRDPELRQPASVPSEHILTVLVVPGCPYTRTATELARDAAASTGLGARTETIVVHDHDQAERLGFTGSPSFHLDGHDLFPQDVPPAVACRIYLGPDGQGGIPGPDVLARALRAVGTGG